MYDPAPIEYQTAIKIKTDHGYTVDCYGDIDDESVITMVFDDENFDGISDSNFKTWAEAVQEISDFAELRGLILLELEAE
jgi:hypothetical protein